LGLLLLLFLSLRGLLGFFAGVVIFLTVELLDVNVSAEVYVCVFVVDDCNAFVILLTSRANYATGVNH
jgi:hypothetical protein